MENSIFKIQGLNLFDKRSRTAFRNLSFELRPGEVHAIISTQVFTLDRLLDMLCGKPPYPTSGSITCLGKTYAADTFLRNDKPISYILRENMLYDDFRVLDNINFRELFSFHYRREARRKACQAVLDEVSLDIDLDQLAADLSPENRKMVEFLKFFLNSNQIAVVYEPVIRFSGGYMLKLNRLINMYKEKGKSIIFLTSSADDVLKIADRISVLDRDQINKTYGIEEIYKNPKKLFDLLVGWTHIDNVPEDRYLEDFDSLVQIRNISFSSYELSNVLQTLAMNIRRIERADYCNIYLNYNEDILVVSTEDEECRLIPRVEFVRHFLHSNSEVAVFQRSSDNYRELLEQGVECGTFVCFPIALEGIRSGLLMIGYKSERTITQNDEILMVSLAKEITLAIETSRLLGRSTLLQESHHRIKNNLQSIINLLYIQEETAKQRGDYGVSAYVNAVVDRIKSIAIVHDLIAKEKTNSFILLKDVIRHITNIYRQTEIQFTVSSCNINLPYGIATNVALLINEIISNSVKHAFQNQADKRIDIECRREGDDIYICIQDNGCGLPPDFDIRCAKSIGMSIVRSTLGELRGSIRFDCTKGTLVEMRLPEEKFNVLTF